MSRSRVLVVSNYDAVASIRPEAELFAGLTRSGLEVTVLTPPGSAYAPRLEAAGVRVVPWHPRTKLSLADVRRLRRELLAARPHVAFFSNNRALANGVWASLGLPVKVVAYRGYDGNVSWTDPSNWLKLLHPRVDRWWCNAESVRDTISAAVPWRRRDAVVISKGHDVGWYDGTPPVSRESLGFPADAFAIAFAANVRPMKGVPILLRATHHVPRELNVHLVLAGAGLDAPDLRRLVEESPMRDRLHVLGPREDAVAVMAACDGYVLSSTKGESLTKSLMEAMSLGLPAVVTDVPGNRGIVLDGVCGRVVPRGDPVALGRALAELASDRVRARAWGRAARERIRTTWSHDRALAQMRAFVEELAAEGAWGAEAAAAREA